MTGRSVTGVLQFLIKTTMDWHSKKQATVETVICGSEHSSSRTCAEYVLEFRIALSYLGVPIRSLRHMLGDSRCVVDSSITPNGKIYN